MLQKQLKQLINDIADKHKIPNYVVEEIYNNQFRCLRKWIESSEYETILLPKLGKFTPSKYKLKKAGIYGEDYKKIESNSIS